MGSIPTLFRIVPQEQFPHLPWVPLPWGCCNVSMAPLPLPWPNCGCHSAVRAVTNAERRTAPWGRRVRTLLQEEALSQS